MPNKVKKIVQLYAATIYLYFINALIHLGAFLVMTPFPPNHELQSVGNPPKIKPGMKWPEEIKKALSVTKVAVLLISTNFLTSDFISKEEIPALLKASEQDGATILPLILKPSLYTDYPSLKDYQPINDPKKPLSKLKPAEQDEILVSMAIRIKELME